MSKHYRVYTADRVFDAVGDSLGKTENFLVIELDEEAVLQVQLGYVVAVEVISEEREGE